MEGPLKDEFLELVSTYLVTLRNVKQFITSTTKAMFARIQSAYFAHELKPMPTHEASELLDKVTPGVDFGEYKEAIVRLCEGKLTKNVNKNIYITNSANHFLFFQYILFHQY